MRNCTMQTCIYLGISFLTTSVTFVSPMEHRRILQGNKLKITHCHRDLRFFGGGDVYVTSINDRGSYQLPTVWELRNKPSYCRQYGI